MNYYAVKEDTYIYTDCDFSSKLIGRLDKETSLFTNNKEIGAWMNITTEDNSINGWIYHYTANGINTLIEGYKVNSPIRIGDAVTIISNMTYAKDYFNNILQVKEPDMTNKTFIVKDIILDPMRIKIIDNNKTYWFLSEKINDPKANKRMGISLMAENSENSNDTSSAVSDAVDSAKQTASDTLDYFSGLVTGDSPSLLDSYKSAVNGMSTEEADAITSAVLDNLSISSIKNIHGCPYQFMPSADMRVHDGSVTNIDGIGTKYAENIVTKIPVLLMSPGVPLFMKGYNESEREQIIKKIASSGVDELDNDNIQKIFNQSGRFYDLEPAWASYYKYVNPLCQMAAVLLGLGDVEVPYGSAGAEYSTIPGIPILKDSDGKQVLSRYRWEYASSEPVAQSLNFAGGVAFYVNSESQVSESISSETTQSVISSKINSISDQMREMIFLSSASAKLTMNKDINALAMGKKNNQTSGDRGIMTSIFDSMGNILTGGKMMFPELWSDSSFSRDYNVSLKFVSPDCDKLSLYMNIIVPLIHLLGLAAPRSLGSNTYTSPFLIRAYYKGFFNINMGIITSMSINKGGEGFWTYAGIPTQIEVNVSIKDLYGIMMLTLSNSTNNSAGNSSFLSRDTASAAMDILTNTVLMDYLCNLCGININEPDIMRTLTLYKQLFYTNTGIVEFARDQYNRLTQWIYNKELNIYNFTGGGWYNSLKRLFE